MQATEKQKVKSPAQKAVKEKEEKPLRRTKCTGECEAKLPYYEGHPRLFIWKCRELRERGKCPLEREIEYEI